MPNWNEQPNCHRFQDNARFAFDHVTLTSQEGQIVKVKVANERPHTSYYICPIGTNSLNGTFFEIYASQCARRWGVPRVGGVKPRRHRHTVYLTNPSGPCRILWRRNQVDRFSRSRGDSEQFFFFFFFLKQTQLNRSRLSVSDIVLRLASINTLLPERSLL